MMTDFLARVLNFALAEDIGFDLMPLRHPDTPPLVDTENRHIVLNSSWRDQNELPFQAAHEIAHIENGDIGIQHYSPCSDVRTESAANRRALEIVVPLYFSDLEFEEANGDKFVTDLRIPAWLWDEAHSKIVNYYLFET